MSSSEIIVSGVMETLVIASKELKKRPKVRKKILTISSIVLTLSIIGAIVSVIFFNENEDLQIIFGVLSGFSFTIFIISIMSYLVQDTETLDQHLKNLALERNELSEKIKNKSNVMDVIKINLNQLNEYYTINKVQAKRSYSFSITMIIIGFGILITGITLWFYEAVGLNITIIASLSGVIAEFIGATSLLMYKESTKQIQIFFDKLSYLQHIMLAVELAERLDDDKKADEISAIILSLVGNYKTKVTT